MDERVGTESVLRGRFHETLARLVDSSPFGIYLVDADFKLALVSDGARPTFAGIDPLIGRDFAEVLRTLWPEAFAREVIARFRATLDTGEPYRAADTTERRQNIDAVESYDWQIERIALPDGRCGVVCHYDATRLRQSERARRASEERYRALFDAIDEGFCIIELMFDDAGRAVDYRFGETNAAFEKYSGLHDATGRRMRELAPDHDPYWFEWYGRVATTGEAARTTAGSAALGRWWDVYASRIGGPESREVAVVFNDVTERRRDERRVRQSEQHYRALAAASSDVAYRMSADWSDMLPIDGRNLVRSNDESLCDWAWLSRNIPLEEHARIRAAIAKAVADKTHFELEHRVCRPDGTIGWTFSRAVPILDERGEVSEWFGAASDITDRKRAEAERQGLLEREQAARIEAELAGRMKDEFLATLSHELRTPLSAILGWSQVLRKNTTPPEALDKGLATIERNARAQAQIIDDLLDMSRIISGKVALDPQRIDLAAAVRAAMDTVRAAAAAKGIALILDVDERAQSPVLGDLNRLQQVFWNLLSNAIKFTPGGGVVEARIRAEGAQWRVDVIDDGEGIATVFVPYVFDRFRQADASITRRHGGLGLGLAIVKQIVELHGGSVSVQSDGSGAGSTFTVLLPRMVAHASPTAGDGATVVPRDASETPGHARDGAPWDAATTNLRGATILIVDDEPDARSLLTQLLEDQHARVLVARDAAEAYEVVQRDRPDVIVSDVGMPREDGLSLLQRIRRLPADRGGDVPAIALTAYASAEDRMKAIRAGFQVHVSKPVEPDALLRTIDALLARGPRAP